MLGYGQHCSFTRWFASEFGAPPARWREQARTDAASGA
jgi:transcriptional regulator GlxA family with amidase domain